MTHSLRPLALFAALAAAVPAHAQIAFDAPFTEHAVLQRGHAIPVHGTAPAGTTVTVSLDGASATGVADAQGHWRAVLPQHHGGGPYRLEASGGGATAAFDDVMIGDVWLCSGQSNMEFTLRHATNSDTEVAQSSRPMLRLFNVPRQSSAAPEAKFAQPTAWQLSSPASAADFSAACWIMGRDLQAHEDIAIGLIGASWGGSVIEDWISADSLATLPRYRPDLDLLARYRESPQAARAEWMARVERWLATHDGAGPATGWIPVPSFTFWEEWGGDWAHFDGTAFFRTHVRLARADLGAARLVIGKVDDVDVTRVNGRTAGSTWGWDTDRAYDLPAGMLEAGDNELLVASVDTGGGGGLWGDAPARVLRLASGREIPLDHWEVARGSALAATGAPPMVPWVGGSGRTSLYNGMIAPLGDYPLAGFAWYQGEANVTDWTGYAELMPLLIADWRKRFDSMPFLMVQLAGFGPLVSEPVDDVWARLRDVQRRVADADGGVGMASALDIGQVGDIHPTNKQDVGHRLALAARRIALGESIEARGPSPAAVTRTPEGIRVTFDHGPLVVVAGGEAIGFELCDAEHHCRFVSGKRDGDDAILLPADPSAAEARYLWQASPLVNLYNPAGLPATGFALPIR